MEALVPAFVAALLLQTGDRAALLTAILADRHGRPLLVALAAGLAHGLGNGVAALGGLLVAPMLTPNAQALILALALFFAGAGFMLPLRTPDRLERWRLGALLTPFLGVFSLAAGDATQFLTFALATQGQPWFAAAGASAGAFAVSFVAAVLGELGWARIPLRWYRLATGLILLMIGLIIGAGALRLL